MAARKKFTAIGIKSLKPPKSGRLEVLDTIVPQLALRVTPNGTKSFAVRTRIKGTGKQVRATLGEFPSTSLEDARQAARDALNMAKRGINLTNVRQQETADIREQSANTVGAVADLFIEKYAKRKNRQWRETQRIFDRYVKPSWGKRPLADITKPDVVALLDSIEDGSGVYMANRTLAAVRKLFNWAMDERGLIGATPIGRGMARAGEKARTRHLTNDEICAIWQAADQTPYPFGPHTKLMLLTGQRLGEVAGMRWDQIEDDVWTLPASATKANREHTVPLSDLALEVLRDIPQVGNSGLVFTTNDHTPISGFSKAKVRLNKQSGITDWRFHDLRATMATRMEAELHIAPHIVGACLNHDPKAYKGITAVYTRGDAIDGKRAAMAAWDNLLAQITGGASRDIVVELVQKSDR
jgi:integrase